MLPATLASELLRPGEVTVLAGRPGQGKTSLALLLASAAIDRKESAVYFSLKTEKGRLLKRLLCLETGIPLTAAMSDEIPRADQRKADSVLKRLSRSPLHIFDSAASVKVIAELSRRVAGKTRAARRPLALIVIDYLERVSEILDDGSARNATAVIRTLKGLARELDTPVLLMSLARRRADTSGTLERDIKRVLLKVERSHARARKIRLKFDKNTGSLSRP